MIWGGEHPVETIEAIEKTLENATMIEDLTKSLRNSLTLKQEYQGGIKACGRNTSEAMYSKQYESSFAEESSKAYRDHSSAECR